MMHRERVLSALNHQLPDRVPIDFGSHPNASIHILAYEKLKKYLGVTSQTRTMHRWMQVAEIDEDVLKLLDIDLRRLALGTSDTSRERDLDEISYVDQWGLVRYKPKGTYYYELQKSPLAGEITQFEIIAYPWPDPHDPGITRGLRERADQLRQNTDYAINLTLPSPFIHTTQFLRGFQDWYLDCASDPQLLTFLFDLVLDINIAITQDALREVGDLIDIVTIADDIGGQDRLIVSPTVYRRLIKPRHERYIDAIRNLTNAKLLFHTCGSIYDVIEDLIEIGIDALNPVQVSATKMDTYQLKTKVGNRLAFWGGIDTHHILPNGSLTDVRAEVRHRIDDLGKNGGYVLSAVHNIQPEVPPENICSMFQAAHELDLMERYKPL